MVNLKFRLAVTASVVIAVLLMAYGGTNAYAWLINSTYTEAPGSMGMVDIEVDNTTAINASGTKKFTITNNGSISAYIRLTGSAIYRNDAKEDTTKDTTAIGFNITNVNVTENSMALKMESQDIIVYDYNTKVFNLLYASGENAGKYFVLQPGMSVTGILHVTGTGDFKNLHVMIVLEAIQATAKAVSEASTPYGWSVGLVGVQDSTIVLGGGI